MTQIEISVKVPESLNGERFDKALASLLTEYSRALITDWIKAGSVTLDGKVVKPKVAVKTSQEMVVKATLEEVVDWQAEVRDIPIIYEDDALLIVDKPAGWVVHPGAGNPKGTLVNALLNHLPNLSEVPRAGIVHRLDKDTTGLMVVAKTVPMQHKLSKMIAARAIKREYECVIVGRLIAGGTVDAPIGRHPQKRILMSVNQNGRTAITHYRVVQRFASHTHVRVTLETGRTHQIRVHMAHIGFPLVGDKTYGRFQKIKGFDPLLLDYLKDFPRQALHACDLSFEHPVTKAPLHFHSDLPSDFQELLQHLK